MELLGQPAGVCRCVYEAMTHPLLLRLTQGQMLVLCQQRHREREGLGAMAGCVFSLFLSFHHARRVVWDSVQAEGQQIDYPVCRKCVQGLCRQAGNK